METFHWYKGFGVRYVSMTGTTSVEQFGFELTSFRGFGESKGREVAHGWIDSLPHTK